MSAAKSRFVRSSESPAGQAERVNAADVLHRKQRARKVLRWLVPLILVVALAVLVRYASIPTATLVNPRMVDATETLAVAGVVKGRTETTVAPEVQGTVARLFVRENSQVRKGDLLAILRNRAVETQTDQANAALATARAEYAQIAAGTQATELAGAQAAIRQAQAAFEQARATVHRLDIAKRQSEAALTERRAAVHQAEAAVKQAQARADLAENTLLRTRKLFDEGAVSRARLEEADSANEVASSEVNVARQVLASGVAYERVAQEAVLAAAEDIHSAEHGVKAAAASVDQARARLATLAGQPRKEAVSLAGARVAQAEANLAAAKELAQTIEVRAPFDGIVTQIVAEQGSTVGGGILKLVQSSRMEVRLDIDEGNIAEVQKGQRAVITLPKEPDRPIQAHVQRISSYVDPVRGTLEVTVVPDRETLGLRSGQTVDVNVVLRESVKRITVPAEAVKRKGDQTVLFVVEDGRARARQVTTGLTSDGWVTILSGITASDQVIQNATSLENGARVRRAK